MLLPSIEVTGVANAMIEVFWHVQRYFYTRYRMAVCENPQRRTQKLGNTSLCSDMTKAGIQISFVLVTAVKGHYLKTSSGKLHRCLPTVGSARSDMVVELYW